ncbi:hypothetical protein BGY98DRAFT_930727 [Russula aff. rugulosa BPL654]|nr:hypothetical protein BGY98DRAFT_930727 [Russula aff. rugulosa BPL654]
MALTKHKPVDPLKSLLKEILGYAKKAVEEETNGQKLMDKTLELGEKLTKSVEHLGKSAERLEAAAAELNGKLTTVSNTSSQLESTANSYKDALLKVPAQVTHVSEGQRDVDPALSLTTHTHSISGMNKRLTTVAYFIAFIGGQQDGCMKEDLYSNL